jgi:hypothetical protein
MAMLRRGIVARAAYERRGVRAGKPPEQVGAVFAHHQSPRRHMHRPPKARRPHTLMLLMLLIWIANIILLALILSSP